MPEPEGKSRRHLLAAAAEAREKAERAAAEATPAGPARPLAFRVVGRSVLAGLGTELGVGVVVLGTYQLALGEVLPLALWAYLVAFGLLAGAVFAAAEIVARRKAVWLGILVALPLIPAVPLGAQFALQVAVTLSPVKAFAATISELDAGALPLHLVFVSGAFALYGPLLAVRARDGSVFAQAYAMTLGALAWLAVMVFVPVELLALNLTLYLLPLAARIVLFAPLLELAERAFAVRDGSKPAASDNSSARTPGQRHKAKWLDEQGARQLADGELAEGAATLERACDLWPTGERALLAAKAWVRLDEPYQAIDKLRLMLTHPRPGAQALEDAAFDSIRELEAFVAMQEEGAAPRPAPRPAQGPSPIWTLHALALSAGAVLVALAIVPIYSPDVPAEVSRARVRAMVWIDAEEMYGIGERLTYGTLGQPTAAAPPKARTLGLAAAFALLEVSPPLGQDSRAAQEWFLRAAEAGHLGATLRYAETCWVEGEHAEAVRWFQRAAEAGNTHAMFRLGAALRWGQGIERDVPRALQWYTRAAEGGNRDAMHNLGLWLEVGRDVERDLPAALSWLERAREAGHPTSGRELRRLRRRLRD